ncbi:MAG TPA: hypothetical protein VHM91_16315 [Verrucomicrobiales bacterium]|nr:hypothetical protein [Verrucomicrobiales bacterium]
MKRIKRILTSTFAAAGMLSLCNCTCSSCKTGSHGHSGEKGAACCKTGAACCSGGGACCAAHPARKS